MKIIELIEKSNKNVFVDCFPSFNELLKDETDKKFWDIDFLITTKPENYTKKDVIFLPIFERDKKIETKEEALNTEIKSYKIIKHKYKKIKNVDFIITRHEATKKYLMNLYPTATLLEVVDDFKIIENKIVAGVLPPNLIEKCEIFIKFSIKDFDYAKDNDMSFAEIVERGFEINAFSLTALTDDYEKLFVNSQIFFDEDDVVYTSLEYLTKNKKNVVIKGFNLCNDSNPYIDVLYKNIQIKYVADEGGGNSKIEINEKKVDLEKDKILIYKELMKESEV